jgi:uroporphyrinogen-III synthase
MSTQEQTLAGRTIAVPETRELDVFSAMLERRGASVLRCPLVAIRDAQEPQLVLDWIRSFNAGAFDDLILLTGEGLRRLLSCIDLHEPALKDDFVARLARVRKITRGPKPARALRELGLKPDVAAVTPTTDGVIASLRSLELAGRHVAVQLYGTEPNLPLVSFLEGAGASVTTVAPYIYVDEAEDDSVRDLLARMAAGGVDAIAFTSTPQVERLFAVGSEELVRTALEKTHIAAIGPVVADALARHGIRAELMPQDSYFMKPLTATLEAAFGKPSTPGS